MINNKLTILTYNTYHAGRKMKLPPEEQVAKIGDDLLKQGADVIVLPEMREGLVNSGALRTLTDKLGSIVKTVVKFVGSTPIEGIKGAVDALFSLVPKIPVVQEVASLFHGVIDKVLDLALGIVKLAGNISGDSTHFLASINSAIVESLAKIGVVGEAIELAENGLVKLLSAIGVKDIFGLPVSVISGDRERLKEITEYMNSKQSECRYTYDLKESTGTISKYKILKSESNGDAGGGTMVLDYDKNGKISDRDILLDTIHTNYLKYAAYLPRGGSSDIPTPNTITTDPAVIQKINLESGRTAAIQKIIENHKNGPYKHLLHFQAGDYNEPSHLDYTEETKYLYDHNGSTYQWDTSKMLEAENYVDSFRAVHPDPVKAPGITWGSPAHETGNVPWLPNADDRDRIDFIYHLNGKVLNAKPIKSVVKGSNEFFVKDKIIKQSPLDGYQLEDNPASSLSDHKMVLSTYQITEINPVGQPIHEIA